MTSSRLPGKVMMEVDDRSMLEYHLKRLDSLRAKVVVATSVNAADDVIEKWCQQRNISVYRGDELDVLERFYNTHRVFGGEVIVRVTSDCPLIDSTLILNGLAIYEAANNEWCYVSNCFPRSFARGFDFEIFSAAMLNEAHLNATESSDREHVTPYFWKNRQGKYEMRNLEQEKNHSAIRITLDEEDDFALIRKLLKEHNALSLGYSQIEELLLSHPELLAMNAHIEQKKA